MSYMYGKTAKEEKEWKAVAKQLPNAREIIDYWSMRSISVTKLYILAFTYVQSCLKHVNPDVAYAECIGCYGSEVLGTGFCYYRANDPSYSYKVYYDFFRLHNAVHKFYLNFDE